MDELKLLLNGYGVKVKDRTHWNEVMDKLLQFLNIYDQSVEEIYGNICKYNSKAEPKWIFLNKYCGMRMICFPLKEKIVKKDGTMLNGVLSYCHNLDEESYSEFGDCFFEGEENKIKRIG